MHVTKWGEYGILCSVFLAQRYLAGYLAALETDQPGAVTEKGVVDNSAMQGTNKGPVGALEVAQAQGIPAQYTQQILQRLRRGGIVASIRGAHGGYVLARHPAQITLLDIMKAAEGSTFDVMCETSPAYPGGENPSECVGGGIGGCNLKEVWLEVRTAIDTVLTGRTLESLLVASSNTSDSLVQITTGKSIPNECASSLEIA